MILGVIIGNLFRGAHQARVAIINKKYLLVTLALLTFALFAGCQPSTSPTTQLPLLSGRLIYLSDDNRYWQVSLQDGDSTTQDITNEPFTLPGQGTSPIFSPPDGRYKVEAFGDDWQQRDTSDGTDRPLVDQDTLVALSRPAFDRDCEAMWSGDGLHVAVLAGQGLYVAGTDGMARLILQRRAKLYTKENSGALVNNQAMLETRITCPVWLAPDTIMISHFAGSLPESFMGNESQVGFIGQYRHEELDTTSILHITSSGAEIRNIPGLWQVAAMTQNGTFVVLRQAAARGDIMGDYYLADLASLLNDQDPTLIELTSCNNEAQCDRFAFSQDGQSVAFQILQPVARIEVWNGGSEPFMSFPLEQGLEPQGNLFWSPDGDAIVYTRGWDKPENYIVLLNEGRILPLEVVYTTQLPAYLVGWIK